MEIKPILKYINYRLTAYTEHDLHSPFLYNFYTELIKNEHPYGDFELLDGVRKKIKADKSFYETAKRIFDACFAIIAFAIFSPFFILFFILIPITSRGGAIYKQKRVGRDGAIFTLYKFRSMQKNAEKDGAMWAQTNDLRTTKIGNFLRRSHLDELPQLFNILKGDVSFVGPRPERPEFTEILSKEIPHYFMRQIVTPGITGWAQIKFRYANSIADSREKFEYDLYYIKNQNIFSDIGIIIKTIKLFF